MPLRVPLRVVLLTLFVVSSVSIGLVAFVPTFIVGQRGVESTARELRLALEAHVNDILRRYVTGIQLANDQFYEMFQMGNFDPYADGLVTMQLLCSTLKSTPDLVFTQIGTQEDGFFWGCEKAVLPGGGAEYTAWYRNYTNYTSCDLYAVDNVTFHNTRFIKPLVGYDPRLRGWYRVNYPRQAWTTPYLWASGEIVGVTAGRPLFYPNGTKYGVYAVDIIIGSVTQFLRGIDFGSNGNAFIVDRNTEELVGLSWLGEEIMMNVTGGDVNDWQIELKRAEHLALPQMRRVVGKLGGSSTTVLAQDTGLADLGEDWVSVNDLDDPYGLRWRIVVALQREDYLGAFLEDRTRIVVSVVCVIVAMLAVQTALTHQMLASLTALTRRMQEMNAKTLTDGFDDISGDAEGNDALEASGRKVASGTEDISALAEVAVMQASFNQMATTIQSFSRYVPKEVVCDLMFKGQLAEVGVAPTHCTVLFADIAKFTTISQRVVPEDLAAMMEVYYDAQTRVINNHGGIIDKFIGDAIMVCWGAPIEIDNQNVRACATGIAMLNAVASDKLQNAFKPTGIPLAIRVGISSGVVLAGNMGGQTRLNYTLIGDAVNLAARLESLNKQLGTALLVSEDMIEDVEHVFVTRLMGHMQVAGFERAAHIYEVVGLVPEFADKGKTAAAIQRVRDHHDSSSNPPSSARSMTIHTARSGATARTMQSARSGAYAMPMAEAQAMRAKRLAAVLGVEEVLTAARDQTHICTITETEFCDLYSRAVQQFLKRDFAGAMGTLNAAKPLVPAWGFKLEALHEQCASLIRSPPPADWSGTLELSNK